MSIVPAASRVEIVARCYADWPDFDDALSMLTPAGACRWGNVLFSRDDSRKPDWYIFFNHPGPSSVELFAPANRVIFASAEPPLIAFRRFNLGQGAGTFVMTSDESLALRRRQPRRFVSVPCMTRTWSVRRNIDWLRGSSVPDKPKRLSWVTSDDAFLKGHRERLGFLAKLRERVEFDLFGHGFNPIADKWDGIAPYRYSVAFENTTAPLYFTEKIMDCFVAGTMPIYVGSPSIGEFFPPEAMVRIDPDDASVFDLISSIAASDLYLRRREAILEAKRLTLERYNLFARLAGFIEGLDEPAEPPQHMRVRPIDWGFPPPDHSGLSR